MLAWTAARRATVTAQIVSWRRRKQHCCINLPPGSFDRYRNGTTIANDFDQRVVRPDHTLLPLDPLAPHRRDSPFQANTNI